ncbi:MAG: hypothetical protein HY536_01520 [Candidatus Colwellbacteria bacterium]|nr:hypothetical protein [Candidatus Colwellbacteria bacterium]
MKRLLLIDANSLVYRAFFALPPLTGKNGEPTGALYGVVSMLIKIFREERPEYAAAAFDRPEPTFRKEAFAGYKATRPPTPSDLVSQLAASQEIFRFFGVKTFELPGYEADDIVGTLAERFRNDGDIETVIFSGDLDTLQLVGGNVSVQVPKKGIGEFARYDEKGVEARFGLPPRKLPDYKGLVGETTDNIPGVPGIGPKTAAAMLAEFDSLEEFYELSPAPKSAAYRKALEAKEQALLSKRLATINRGVPIEPTSIESLRIAADRERARAFCEEKNFMSLVGRLDVLN